MSRRDTYHHACKRALIRDGWTITHDPLPIIYGGTALSTDLGAEKSVESKSQIIAVEFIAVEVKDFDTTGAMSNFEKALGHFAFINRCSKEMILTESFSSLFGKRLMKRSFNCL
jgi:XisH protein